MFFPDCQTIPLFLDGSRRHDAIQPSAAIDEAAGEVRVVNQDTIFSQIDPIIWHALQQNKS